eukprot:6310521-Prymnesium_polylepis.1
MGDAVGTVWSAFAGEKTALIQRAPKIGTATARLGQDGRPGPRACIALGDRVTATVGSASLRPAKAAALQNCLRAQRWQSPGDTM